MLICSQCGADNLAGSVFCNNCQSPLTPPINLSSNINTSNTNSGTNTNNIQQLVAGVNNGIRACLIFEENRQPTGKSIQLSPPEFNTITLGRIADLREPQSIPDIELVKIGIKASKVSRKHLRFIYQNGIFFIEDIEYTDSNGKKHNTNGTLLQIHNTNDWIKLIPSQEHIINNNDKIMFGELIAKFIIS